MGVIMGSREALEILVTDKVTKRFGLTDWGGEDFDPEIDAETGEPLDPDAIEAEEELEVEEGDRAANADKWFRAYAGGYEEVYNYSGAQRHAVVFSDVAQRFRAVRGVEAQPQYKGEGIKVAEYILPEDLQKAGYRVERGDNFVRWARGRGRNVIKGSDHALDDFAMVIYQAHADLDQRGGPAKSRSKKAKEEAPAPEPEAVELPKELWEAGYRLEYNAHNDAWYWTLYHSGRQNQSFGDLCGSQAEAVASAAEHYDSQSAPPLEPPDYEEDSVEDLELEEEAIAAQEEALEGEITAEELTAIRMVEAEAREEEGEGMEVHHMGYLGAKLNYPIAEPAKDLAAMLGRYDGPTGIQAGLLRVDGDTQSREEVSQDAIFDYAEAMTTYGGWGQFPPVKAVYDGQFYWVWDGHQRLAAFKSMYPNRPEEEIPAEIRPGDRRLAVLLSTGANADHGVRRSRADKQKAVTRLLKDEEWRLWSDAEIARHTHVDPKTVGNVRARLEANREIPDTLVRKTADGHSVKVEKREVKPLPARHNKPTPEPAKEVYTVDNLRTEGIPSEDRYTPIIEAGFYLESYGSAIDYRVRWAYDEEGDHKFGEWLTFARAAADQGLRWWNAFPREKPEEAPAPTVEEAKAPEPAPARPHGLGGYTVPELRPMPAPDERIAAALDLLDLYRAFLKSLPAYERLTGKFTRTPEIRRTVTPLLEDVQRLVDMLGERAEAAQ